MVFFNINRDPFFVHKIIMKSSGVWPLDRDKTGSFIIFSVFSILQIVNIVLRLIDPYGKCEAYKMADASFTLTWWFFISMILISTLRVKGNKMIPLIESTIDDWSSITDPEERKIMENHDNCGCHFFVSTIILVAFSIVEFVRSMICPNEYPSLYGRSRCIFNDGSWGISMEILSKIIDVIGQITIIMATLLFWSFSLQLSAQYKILKRQFQEFLLIEDKKESRRIFRLLVDRHNELLDLSGDIEDALGFFGGLHVLMMQMLACLCASQLGHSIKAMDFARIMIIFKNLGLTLMTPCIYYYAGDKLTASCEEIGEAFTECNWYDLSKESIKNFSVVIARTRVPKTLTFWKFHQYNLSNLKYTLQAIYSYVSLVVAIESE